MQFVDHEVVAGDAAPALSDQGNVSGKEQGRWVDARPRAATATPGRDTRRRRAGGARIAILLRPESGDGRIAARLGGHGGFAPPARRPGDQRSDGHRGAQSRHSTLPSRPASACGSCSTSRRIFSRLHLPNREMNCTKESWTPPPLRRDLVWSASSVASRVWAKDRLFQAIRAGEKRPPLPCLYNYRG